MYKKKENYGTLEWYRFAELKNHAKSKPYCLLLPKIIPIITIPRNHWLRKINTVYLPSLLKNVMAKLSNNVMAKLSIYQVKTKHVKLTLQKNI